MRLWGEFDLPSTLCPIGLSRYAAPASTHQQRDSFSTQVACSQNFQVQDALCKQASSDTDKSSVRAAMIMLAAQRPAGRSHLAQPRPCQRLAAILTAKPDSCAQVGKPYLLLHVTMSWSHPLWAVSRQSLSALIIGM